MNDEEWEDYTDRLYEQSEESNKAILASRTAAREALEAPKPARPAASSLELAARVVHKNALSAKRSKKYRQRKKGKNIMELQPPEPEPVRGLKRNDARVYNGLPALCCSILPLLVPLLFSVVTIEPPLVGCNLYHSTCKHHLRRQHGGTPP